MHALAATRGERAERVDELLLTVGLAPRLKHHLPHALSGGQRQRISIARALAVGPQVLIADEPVSALDASIQAQIINLLEELRERLKIAFVFISHDLNVVRHISDRIAVMYLGQVVESGGDRGAVRAARASLHARAAGGDPADRSVAALARAGAGRRAARPDRAARRLQLLDPLPLGRRGVSRARAGPARAGTRPRGALLERRRAQRPQSRSHSPLHQEKAVSRAR